MRACANALCLQDREAEPRFTGPSGGRGGYDGGASSRGGYGGSSYGGYGGAGGAGSGSGGRQIFVNNVSLSREQLLPGNKIG